MVIVQYSLLHAIIQNRMAKKSTSPLIRIWLRDAAEQLADALIPSALLDAEIILAHTLRKSRTWLHAHDDEPLSMRQLDIANARLALRLDRIPIAYIIGHKEFYGRLFKVTPSTLIPRPESEEIITLLKEYAPTGTLIDVGTGTGCLGITAKLELPKLRVVISDTSRFALKVAEENARILDAEVIIEKSDLLADIAYPLDVIIANLPYVDPSWDTSPETRHEPEEALFARMHGLELILKLITQSQDRLRSNGLLFLEADVRQHQDIIDYADKRGFIHEQTSGLIIVFRKA